MLVTLSNVMLRFAYPSSFMTSHDIELVLPTKREPCVLNDTLKQALPRSHEEKLACRMYICECLAHIGKFAIRVIYCVDSESPC